jgi:hypothetical protein
MRLFEEKTSTIVVYPKQIAQIDELTGQLANAAVHIEWCQRLGLEF